MKDVSMYVFICDIVHRLSFTFLKVPHHSRRATAMHNPMSRQPSSSNNVI